MTIRSYSLLLLTITQALARDRIRVGPPPPQPRPDLNEYRNYNGSSNNLANPTWGTPLTVFRRLLSPDYADGVSKPRVSSTGGSLPSARFVSSTVVRNNDTPFEHISHMLMQWGQFLDHDLTLTPTTRTSTGGAISCCLNGEVIPPATAHPDCFPIEIKPDDSFYSQFNLHCLNFVRSACGNANNCTLGTREQMNSLTSFIDGSQIYGSSESRANSLRSFVGGQLLMSNTDDHQLLPVDPGSCTNANTGVKCYMAGDTRVNEQPNLATMHTIWAREHNRIAKKLAVLNPSWSDEILFQEARRIVGAELQHITYNEFLPIVLGKTVMKAVGILPLLTGHNSIYNATINPSISNEFATAAYRFGHSLIDGNFKMYDGSGAVTDTRLLRTLFNNPTVITVKEQFLGLVRGLNLQAAQKRDSLFTTEINHHLFEANGKFGSDLVSLNIQRGRDHGLPAYYKFRKACNAKVFDTFDGFSEIPPDVIESLKIAYNNIAKDVDLFIGGISEAPFQDGIVGKTFNCILLDTFIRLRRGDRFFYEERGPGGFTLPQLSEIKKVSLSKVVCDNTDVNKFPKAAFLKPSQLNNPLLDCSKIPSMALEPWRI